jgi:hypothetical protein
MKNIIIILGVIILGSCAKPIHVYDYKNDMLGEKTIIISFDTEKEAKRVQRRISRAESKPYRMSDCLILTIPQLEAKWRFFNKGFIKEKYRYQIDIQL